MFQQFLHTGKPSADELYNTYKLNPVPIINRVSYPGWTDKLGMPSLDYFKAAAKIQTPTNLLVIDHEDWPLGTRAERIDAATRYAIVYKTMKHFRPELRIGFYAFTPIRDLFNAIAPKTSDEFLNWQGRNEDMAEMYANVDVLLPSIYYFYTRATDGANAVKNAPLYFQRNIEEAIRLRDLSGSRNRPVIPYLWWMKHSGDRPLDLDVWESMIQTSLDMCGNAIAWGGWLQTWNPNDKWLKILQERSTTNTGTEL